MNRSCDLLLCCSPKSCLDLRRKVQGSADDAEVREVLYDRRARGSEWQQSIDDRLESAQHFDTQLSRFPILLADDEFVTAQGLIEKLML